MSEEQSKPDEKSNVVSLDTKRLENLKHKNYVAILDEAELLRLKFHNGQIQNPADAFRFVTLCKFIMQHGHSEAVKYSYKMIYDQFMMGL